MLGGSGEGGERKRPGENLGEVFAQGTNRVEQIVTGLLNWMLTSQYGHVHHSRHAVSS